MIYCGSWDLTSPSFKRSQRIVSLKTSKVVIEPGSFEVVNADTTQAF